MNTTTNAAAASANNSLSTVDTGNDPSLTNQWADEVECEDTNIEGRATIKSFIPRMEGWWFN